MLINYFYPSAIFRQLPWLLEIKAADILPLTKTQLQPIRWLAGCRFSAAEVSAESVGCYMLEAGSEVISPFFRCHVLCQLGLLHSSKRWWEGITVNKQPALVPNLLIKPVRQSQVGRALEFNMWTSWHSANFFDSSLVASERDTSCWRHSPQIRYYCLGRRCCSQE